MGMLSRTAACLPRPNDNFTWHNYFDVDDVLGYPLHTMADSYDVDWVKDHKVGVGGFLTRWNPASLQNGSGAALSRQLQLAVQANLAYSVHIPLRISFNEVQSDERVPVL